MRTKSLCWARRLWLKYELMTAFMNKYQYTKSFVLSHVLFHYWIQLLILTTWLLFLSQVLLFFFWWFFACLRLLSFFYFLLFGLLLSEFPLLLSPLWFEIVIRFRWLPNPLMNYFTAFGTWYIFIHGVTIFLAVNRLSFWLICFLLSCGRLCFLTLLFWRVRPMSFKTFQVFGWISRPNLWQGLSFLNGIG